MSRIGKLRPYLEAQGDFPMDAGLDELEAGEVAQAISLVLEWFAGLLAERAPEDTGAAAVVREASRRVGAQLGELVDLMDALLQESGEPWWVIACENAAADPDDGDDGRLYVSEGEAGAHVEDHKRRCGCSDAQPRVAGPEDVL